MNIEQRYNGRVHETAWTIAAGESKTFGFSTEDEATVVVHAIGAGVSAAVSFSCSPAADIAAGTGRFVVAKNIGANGVVSNASDYAEILTPINALKVEATGGDVIVEVLQ